VELLVVIGIIAILIAILMPTLRRAREVAITVECASNLRQVGIMMAEYIVDNEGVIPEGFMQGLKPDGTPRTDTWNSFFTAPEYAPLQPNGTLHCPNITYNVYGVPYNNALVANSYYTPWFPVGEFFTYPYGTPVPGTAYSSWPYQFNGVNMRILRNPANFVLAMDSVQMPFSSGSSPNIALQGAPYFVTCQQWSSGQVVGAWLAHPVNTANVLFADFHVENCNEGRLQTVANFNMYNTNYQGITGYWDSNGQWE
jgi:prepilin-type processing-associated H-X9-DG protein